MQHITNKNLRIGKVFFYNFYKKKQKQVMSQKQQLINWDDENSNNSLHLKVINQIKQVTQIRKITQQSLSPVIKKIQEQISHLLSQSGALRAQTSVLQEVQATNLEYKREIQSLKAKINNLQTQFIDLHQSQQELIQQKQSQKQFMNINTTLQQLKKEGKERTQKIKKLTELNQNQTQLFYHTKSYISESFNTMKEQMSAFYSQQIRLNQSNDQKFGKIKIEIQSHNKIIQNLLQDLKQTKKVTTLYSSERDEIRSYLQDLIQLSQLAIRRQEYENDKKVQRIENQLTKTYVQKILSEALTPQIRQFLPTLIQNIQLLKRIEKQIKQCSDDIQLSKQMEQTLSQKILKLQYSTKKGLQQKQIYIKKLQMQLQTKLGSFNQEFKLKLAQTQQKFDFIDQMMKKNKQESDQMFDTFIEKNRTKIYFAVLECKPPEVRQEQERIKNKLISFQQKMQEINKTANQRSDNLLELTNSLESKLQMFQNRITKAKSDLKVQNDNMKRVIQSFNVKLLDSENKMQQQSKIISKLMQVLMLNTSLQIDEDYFNFSTPKYGQQTNQAYISFHDGVIFQASSDIKKNQALYRKKKFNKEILKRTLLKEQAKLIDFITQKLKNWKWQDPKERPSHFFIQNIFPAYETMILQKKPLLQARKTYQQKNPELGFRMSSINKFSHKKSQQSFGRKGSASRMEPNRSKLLSKRSIQDKIQQNTSIQHLKGGLSFREKNSHQINDHTQLYTTIEFHKPNRIKLKKIEQSDKKDKDYGRNRYTMSKNTIQ